MTKLRTIVSITNYFKPTILKFKSFIYNSNSNVVHNFCIHGGNAPPPWGEGASPSEEKFITVGIFRKNASKPTKLMVEPYICDNLTQIY